MLFPPLVFSVKCVEVKDGMKAKQLVLVLGLVVLAVAVSASYVLAHPSSRPYYGVTEEIEQLQEEEWWQEMRQYMEQHWEDRQEGDEEWWHEARQHMEQHWEDIESEGWFDEMRQYMEERWESQDSYGRYGGDGGFGGCRGWRW